MIWSAKLPEYLTTQQTFSCYSEGNVPPLPMLPHIFQEHHKRRNLEKSQNIPPNLPILPHKITQLGLGIIAVPLLDEERSKIRLHRPSQLWPSTLEEDKTFMKYICISVGTLSVSQYTSCSSPRYSVPCVHISLHTQCPGQTSLCITTHKFCCQRKVTFQQ